MDSELAVKVDDDSTCSMVEEQKCLVCAAPSNGHHFGVLSCAACNAFFRRSVAEKRKYACRKSGNCAVDQEIRCICRACRFQKCIAVGMNQTAVQPHRDVIGQKRKRSRAHSSPEHQFSNAKNEAKRAPSPTLNPPQPQASHKYDKSKNMIECLVENYRKLNERRRLFFGPGTIRDILGGKEMPLKPARVGQSERSLRTEVGLAIELFNTIHPFPKLLLDDKVRLFKHTSMTYAVLEKNFLSARGGGVQSNRMIFSNFTYVDLDNYEEYYRSEGANIGMDPETAKKLFLPTVKQAFNEIASPIYHCGLTEAEFIILAIIFLFDRDVDGLTEGTKRAVKDARDKAFFELFAYYEAHGITDGAERFGNALLLIPAIRNIAEQSAENFHIIRFFNVVPYDHLLDELLLNS